MNEFTIAGGILIAAVIWSCPLLALGLFVLAGVVVVIAAHWPKRQPRYYTPRYSDRKGGLL